MKHQLLLCGLLLVLLAACKKDYSCEDCPPVDPAANQPPVARAGMDQSIVLPLDSTLLDGSASADPDGTITAYAWTRISGPASFLLAWKDSAKTMVRSLEQGRYAFELQVTDDGGFSAKDTVQVTVYPAAVAACDNSRPQINARLIPVGTLSQPMAYMATASAGNKILFAGGLNSRRNDTAFTSRVDIYDVVTQSLSTAALSEARYSIAAVASGNKVFFGGGETLDGTFPVSTVDIYDVFTNTWSTAALSLAGHSIAAAAVGNKVLFAGGDGGFTGKGREFRVDIYDLTTNTWSTAALSEGKDGSHAAVTVSNKVYFSGGEAEPPDPAPGSWFATDRIDVYDNATNSWSTLTMLEGKLGHATVAAGGKIYWAGGITGTYATSLSNSCLVEIRDAGNWNSAVQYLSVPAEFYINGSQNAVVYGNKIVFYKSGASNPGKFDIYEITTNTWTIGVLPVDIIDASIIAVNHTIYMAGGWVNGVLSDKIWKLEF